MIRKKIMSVAIGLSCLMLTAVFAGKTTPANNKQIALDFFNAITVKKDFKAASQYLGPVFIEHSPDAVDGYKGLQDLVDDLKKYPESQIIIKRTMVDGDYVMIHVHVIREPNTLGRAVMELFRLENGKVVEHWDVLQEVPAKSENTNGIF